MGQEVKSRNKINKKILFLGLGFIVVICFIGLYRTYVVQQKGVYVITTLYNIRGGRGGMAFDFKYSFRGKEYISYASGSDIYKKDEGKRFFIQVLPEDPERCWVTNIRVPDSIQEAPYDGWKELPIKISQ